MGVDSGWALDACEALCGVTRMVSSMNKPNQSISEE